MASGGFDFCGLWSVVSLSSLFSLLIPHSVIIDYVVAWVSFSLFNVNVNVKPSIAMIRDSSD